MEKKVLYGTWFVLTILTTAIVLVIRKKRISNWALELTDTMHIMVGGFSSLSGLFLVYKVITEFEKLEPIVGDTGMVSISLGSLATIWFGITEIATLIPAKQTPNP